MDSFGDRGFESGKLFLNTPMPQRAIESTDSPRHASKCVERPLDKLHKYYARQYGNNDQGLTVHYN